MTEKNTFFDPKTDACVELLLSTAVVMAAMLCQTSKNDLSSPPSPRSRSTSEFATNDRVFEKRSGTPSVAVALVVVAVVKWNALLEKNQTKITECSFVAVLRKDLESTQYGDTPPVSKLTFVLNPQRRIDPVVTHLTGLSNKVLRHAPLFRQKIKSIISFLQDLPTPVCLVAHNGNCFDFKILLAECNDAGACLPADLMCLDSLIGFRRILKGNSLNYKDLEKQIPTSSVEDILTDDEDDWPDLSISSEEWDEIDELSVSLSDMSCEDVENAATEEAADIVKQTRSKVIRKVFDKNSNKVEKNKKDIKLPNTKVGKRTDCYTLTSLYKRLLNREEENAHRAEEDCMMLVKCVVALKNEFILWADDNCKLMTEIKPLIRY